MTSYSSLHVYLTVFWHFDRRSVSFNLLLNLVAAAVEGLGFMALIPLLKLIAHFQNAEGLPAWFTPPAEIKQWLYTLDGEQRLLLALGLFIGLIGTQSILVTYREQHSPAMQLRFVDHLRISLFQALTAARWRFLSHHHSSEFLSVLTTDLQQVGVGTFYLLQLFSQLALFPMYLAVSFWLSPIVSGLAVVTGILLWWGLRFVSAASKQNGVEVCRANQRLSSEIQEFLGALKLIKIHGESDGYLQQFDQAVRHLRGHLQAFYDIRSHLHSIYRMGGGLALAILTYIAVALLHTPFENLLVLIAVFTRMLPQISKIHLGAQQLWNMLPAFENWQRWINACAAERESRPEESNAPPLQNNIEFRDVLYRHPLSALTCRIPALSIPANRTTVIVGPSGSGKTSFLDLLCGLQQPDSGDILIDGQPLQASSAWFRQLAYVPQDGAIVDGTIRDNLNWGSHHSHDHDLRLALQQAAALEFIDNLPSGLDTWVGERGVRLSGGEKQRLAIARALLRKPTLLILDEATSALDGDNQHIIVEALDKLRGRITVIIVTHHYQDIRKLVDGVIQVDSGLVSDWTAITPSEVVRE